MLLLVLIATPLLFIGALLFKGRQAVEQRQARAEQAALDHLQHALVNSDGQQFHVAINLDFPTSIQFPLSSTISDSKGVTEHFTVDRSGAVTPEKPQ